MSKEMKKGLADVGPERCGACTNCMKLGRLKKRVLACANPPFSHAIPHLLATREHQPDAWVSWILPWAYPGVGEWQPVLDAHPMWQLQPIKGRPWPKNMRETGNYVWGPKPRDGGTRLVLPALDW